MHYKVLFVLAALLVCVLVSEAGCPGNKPNTLPLVTAAPKLVSTTTNGKLYMSYEVNPPIRVLHVYGDAYERGYAAGTLLKEDLSVFLPNVVNYIDTKLDKLIEKYLPFMPVWLTEYIVKNGVQAALDLTATLTRPFTPQHFIEEIDGMSKSSGISSQLITRLNMIPELIKAACSMIGAWGPAINAAGTDDTLFQLRALDWDTSGPFANFPLVTIHHPNKNSGVAFATWGWTGFVGAITGYSSASVGICEKWWATYNGTYFMEGYPFPYLLRDILQFDPDVSAAFDRIMHAQRTCSIWVGLGDNDMNQMRIVQYSHDILNMFSDRSYPEYPNHPNFPGLVYVDRYEQPSHSDCLAGLLRERYGHINATSLIHTASLLQTGDAHAAVYDYHGNYMYVAAASSPDHSPIVPAYDRPFLRLDMTQMWAEPAP